MGLIKLIKKFRSLTIAEKQQITKDQISKMISDLFEQMKLTYKNGLKLVEDNPFGLTKEQVLAGLGKDALELMRLAALLKDCMNVAVPGTFPDGDEYGHGNNGNHNGQDKNGNNGNHNGQNK